VACYLGCETPTQRDELARLGNALQAPGAEIARLPQEHTQTQAALERLRLRLDSEHQLTARLFNLIVRAQPAPCRENFCYFTRPRSNASDSQHLPENDVMSHEDILVVDLSVFWVRPLCSITQDAGVTADEYRPHGWIVVQRVMSHGPADTPIPALRIAESPGEQSGEGHSAAAHLQDAFDKYVAKKLVDPTWKQSTEVWLTPAYEGEASIADTLGEFSGQWHDLALGAPVRYAGGLLILDRAPVDVLADIATELPLPSDTMFKDVKRLLQVTGIVMGVVSGQPLLVNACLKSLVHDILSEAPAR
jgi:hypothetical protein